jgi:2-polyprenyl-6-methoxyphenol hydroxylase-like FAD-dependent oxidoreductase
MTEVLVVGGGPVGLALAVELGLRGIEVVVLERDARHSPQPRAKTTNVRSMEHMRRWGIADRLRAAAPLPADYPTDVVFRTRLFGHDLALFENAFFGARGVRDDRFAEGAQWVPQYKVEAALRARAAELPTVTLRLGTRLESLAQDADGVTAEAIGPEGALEFRAAYAIGADGARSTVRTTIGARMEGQHAYAQHLNMVFRAPALREVMRDRPAIMYWLVNPDCPAVVGPMDDGDVWFFMSALPAGAAVPDEAGLRARLRHAIGRDVAPEILVTDPWSAHSLIADRYREGRILLAGDACHLHPPFGGYGMNLGLGDAVDLGWKLAAVLRGWGGAALLDSYEAERRPVHRRVVEEAVANHALLPRDLARPALEDAGPAGDAVRAEVGALITAGKEREFRTLGVVLGSNYAGSPIVVPDGTAPPEEHPTRFEPSGHPGWRAPHLWLADGASLFDHFGAGFCLLATAPGAETSPMEQAARAAGVPLRVLAPEDARLPALYGARMALIRPDQHVAWRGDGFMGDAAAIMDRARGA